MTMQEAYGRTLEFLRLRKRAYSLVFRSPAGQEVLQDLVKFCRANETTFHTDPRMHAVLEGRREVYLRITHHMNLSMEELYALFGGRSIGPAKGQEDADAVSH